MKIGLKKYTSQKEVPSSTPAPDNLLMRTQLQTQRPGQPHGQSSNSIVSVILSLNALYLSNVMILFSITETGLYTLF